MARGQFSVSSSPWVTGTESESYAVLLDHFY